MTHKKADRKGSILVTEYLSLKMLFYFMVRLEPKFDLLFLKSRKETVLTAFIIKKLLLYNNKKPSKSLRKIHKNRTNCIQM